MSIYLAADENEPAFLASNKGWGDFTRWVEGLDTEQVAHLCEYGWSQETDRVAEELQAALKDSPGEDVAAVAKTLLDAIDGAAVVVVTGGLTPETS